MTNRILLAALLGGAGIFIGGSITHMALPLFDKAAVAAHGGLVVAPPAGKLVPPSKLAIQFVGDLLAGAVATLLLSMTTLSTYVRRVALVAALGLLSGFLVNFPMWNWFGFSTTYVVLDVIDHVLRSAFGGLVIAGIIKRI